MSRNGIHRLCLQLVLLLTQLTQAVTPDPASLTSTRLLELLDREDGCDVRGPQVVAWSLATRDTHASPRVHRWFEEDQDRGQEPEEVCLVSHLSGQSLRGIFPERNQPHTARPTAAPRPSSPSVPPRLTSLISHGPKSDQLVRHPCRMTC